jgi:peptide methionine sulfoxide reductase msrA/msrB
VRMSRWGVVALVAAAGIGFLAWQMGGSMSATTGEAEMSEPITSQEGTREAIFAGGCFWCIEAAFELMPGVLEAISGYTGGHVENPTYEQVITGTTGHFEAVLVLYDPEKISYEDLLEQFWRSIDPTDSGGQFSDRGSQYYTAIFYLNQEQRELAETSKRALVESGVFDKPIVTPILPAQTFYPAEGYHQNYYETYLAQYKAYSVGSGREGFLEETWDGHEDVSLTDATNGPEESADE